MIFIVGGIGLILLGVFSSVFKTHKKKGWSIVMGAVLIYLGLK